MPYLTWVCTPTSRVSCMTSAPLGPHWPWPKHAMNPRILQIASRLRNHFLGSASSTDISIFLCGGASGAEQEVRRILGADLVSVKSPYRYSVFYPEDMFVELILGHQKLDLLKLENLLARSVSAVVILLQSPGTIAELGAFSNHEQLKNKLVVVVEPRYKKSQSFIGTGPIRHLTKETTSRVLFLEMCKSNMDELSKRVAESVRAVSGTHPPMRDLRNPIASYEFYLALLYVLDRIPRWAFSVIAQELESGDPDSAKIAAEAVANGLINKGDAVLVSENVAISRKGVVTLQTGARSGRRLATNMGVLSELRILALNGMLRRRYQRFWGKAA